MTDQKLTPLEIIFLKLKIKNSKQLANILDITPSSITNWKKRSNGKIPFKHFAKLIEYGFKNKVNISYNDLMDGSYINYSKQGNL